MKNWLMLTVAFLVFNSTVLKMFGFLKKKVGDAVKSISEKISGEEKEVKKEVPPAPVEPAIKKEPKAPSQKPVEKKEKKVPEEPEIESPEVVPEIIEEPTEKLEEPKIEKESFTDKLRNAIGEKKLSGDFVDSALFDLEIALLENNVASDVSQKIVHDVRENLLGKSFNDFKKIILPVH